MSATTPVLNLKSILEGVPRGARVAISAQDMRVINFGSDMRKAPEEAKNTAKAIPRLLWSRKPRP